MRMRFQDDSFNGSGAAYVLRQLKKWDTSKLTTVSFKVGKSKRSLLLAYGNMRVRYSRKTLEPCTPFTVNVLIKPEASVSLPRAKSYKNRMTRKYGKSIYYDCEARNLDELIVAVAMHEVRHYLGYTGQFGGDTPYEKQRIGRDEIAAMAFGWMHMAWFRMEQERMAA